VAVLCGGDDDAVVVETHPELFDHQHYFGGLDDGGDFPAHFDIQLFYALSSDDAFDQVITDSNAYLCCDDPEVYCFNRASQLITR
jgi:hypothetical protein